MTDKAFLMWLHERLVHVHKENPLFDYMCKLRGIIQTTSFSSESTNSDTNNIEELRDKMGN